MKFAVLRDGIKIIRGGSGMVQRNKKQEKFVNSLCVKAALAFTTLFGVAAWFMYRGAGMISMTEIVVDSSASAFVLSALAAFYAEWGVKRGVASGAVSPSASEKKSTFSGRPLLLGLVLGAAAAAVFIPSLVVLFRLFGLEGQTFAQYMGFKLVCASSLGFLMTNVAAQHSLRR